MYKSILINNKKYYLYDNYGSWQKAHKIAKQKRKKNKSKYFILKQEKGYPIPTTRYHLYFNKTIKIW